MTLHTPVPPDVTRFPFGPLDFLPPRVEVDRRADGSILLRNPYPVRGMAASVAEPLLAHAEARPDKIWLGARGADGAWERLTYGEGVARIKAIAAALIERGLHPEGDRPAPLMILSGNSLAHALLTYGAIFAGVPVAPVSPSYSLVSSDFDKLRHVFDLVRPGMIFAEDGPRFGRALAALDLSGVEIVTGEAPLAGATPLAELLARTPGPEVDAVAGRLGPDTIAKYLFTSGSTGLPKAVINTHRMMCANAAIINSQREDHEAAREDVLLNWLPWHHTYGGNAILNMITLSGGTLYVDDGRATPGEIEKTVRNLKDVRPTYYSSVPVGYALLAEAMEADAALAEAFFSRLRGLNYGGAALGQDIYDRVQRIAVRVTGRRIPFGSGYGATETGPTIMNVHWITERTGLLGLPLPGVEIKLAPVGTKMEVRVRAPLVTPGYHRRPDLTEKAFDEEGFYRLGDGARFLDPDDPAKGLVFDGRVAEDFKLDTGTWVSAGRLRVQALEALDGLLSDALIAGADRAFVGLLGWPSLPACRRLTGDPDLGAAEACRHPAVLAALAAGLARHNAANPASSTRIARAALLAEPPSLDAGELTDKGYVNQSTSLSRRAGEVAALYAEPPGAGVVVV